MPHLRSWFRPWLHALVIAVGILALMHAFVVRVVALRNVSMYATLVPGDLLLVDRRAAFTGVARGDIVVFRDPLKDHVAMWRRPLLVKRVVGLPGDTVELRDGTPWVNGHPWPWPGTATQAYVVRLTSDTVAAGLLRWAGLPPGLVPPGRSYIELPLNPALADRLAQRPEVIDATPMASATGAPLHLFPYSRRYRWNTDHYGPIPVPARGDTLRLNIDNLPLYDRLIARYERHQLALVGDTLLIDGVARDTYVVEQDHYFVLGDSRHHSADSRHWGFVPADHLVGRVALVLGNRHGGHLRNGRGPHRP